MMLQNHDNFVRGRSALDMREWSDGGGAMTELDKLQEDAVSRLRNPDQLSGLVWGYRFGEDAK